MAEGCQQSSAFVYKYIAHVVSLADLIVSMTATTTPCTHLLLLLRIVINTFGVFKSYAPGLCPRTLLFPGHFDYCASNNLGITFSNGTKYHQQ